MEENSNQQLNNQFDSNNINHSIEQYEKIEEKESSSKSNIIKLIFNN